jgi:hypothetical protein
MSSPATIPAIEACSPEPTVATPDDNRDQRVRPGPPQAPESEAHQHRDTGHGNDQRRDVDRLGVHHANDGHGGDVVNDRHGEEEDPKLGRGGWPHQRQGAEQKGSVGADHDAPAPGRFPIRDDQQIQQSRNHHSANAGEHRQYRPATVGELPDGEVPAHFQADDEEEHRHETVVDPVGKVHLETGVT